MRMEIDPDIITAATRTARERGCDVADVSLDAIAHAAGISRATLYRRIGSRRALDDAVRAAGIDPGGRPDVRERAVAAAAAIIREGGLSALTLDAVAKRADCSIPALHSQIGGREGLLSALFERYSPLPSVEQVLATPPATFEAGVRAIYAAAFDAVTAEPGLIRALAADAFGRPDGPAMRYVVGPHLPRAFAAIGRWLTSELAAGRCRPLPLPLLIQLLAGPMVFHAAGRGVVTGVLGLANPTREEAIDLLTTAFCRAVALPPPAG